MTEQSCEQCYYWDIPDEREPCKTCLANMRDPAKEYSAFRPIKRRGVEVTDGRG